MPEEVDYQNNSNLFKREATVRIKSFNQKLTLDFKYPQRQKGQWRKYNVLDGLADNWVWDILFATDSALWFATGGGGISRYDGSQFINYTTEDGLISNDLNYGFSIK